MGTTSSPPRNPGREEVAWAVRPYVTWPGGNVCTRGRPDRTAILAAVPNRLEYFDRQGFVN